MSDAEWDADNFEVKKPAVSDKWEGEDEDEEVRENWDDEEEADKKEEAMKGAEASAVQVKKKKPLKERLAEKEEKRKQDFEEKRKQEEEAKKQLTPKQIFEEKMRRQKLQEEADLVLIADTYGSAKEESTVGIIDGFDPTTKEDFDKLSQLLSEKITKYEKSPFYVPFMENLVRDLTLGVGADDLKKLSSTLNTMYNEKVKLLKTTKGKKKTKKATLIVEKDAIAVTEDDRYENEFDNYL